MTKQSPATRPTAAPHRLRSAGLALLPALLLSACATQQAVDEQTQPLREQFVRTDQTLQALDAAAQARDLAMLAQIEQLTLEIKTLRRQLAEVTASLLATDGFARNQAAAAGERADDLGRRLAQAGEELKALAAQAGGQGERITRAELRQDELAAQAREAVAQAAAAERQRAADMAAHTAAGAALGERLGKTEQRLDELVKATLLAAEQIDQTEQKQVADAAAAGALGERLGKAEARVEEIAAGSRSLAAEVSREVAAPIAAKAAGDMAAGVRRDLGGEFARLLDGKAAEQAAALQAAAEAEKAARGVLAERVGQGERRLDELAGTLPARVAASERRLDDIAALIDKALELVRHNEIMTNGKVVHTVTLTGDKTLYPLNLPDIHPDDQARLAELVAYLNKMEQETHRKDYHLEIQGHTENIGMDDYTYQLAKARAEAVKRYLREKGGISLNHMSVISYGATVPLDPRGKGNRRIAILVRVLDR